MKLATQFKAVLVAIEEKSMSDGGKYYQMAVLQGSEATSLSCTEDVFKTNPKLFEEYVFGMQISEFSGKKNLRVTGIYNVNGATAVTPGTAAADPGKDKDKK